MTVKTRNSEDVTKPKEETVEDTQASTQADTQAGAPERRRGGDRRQAGSKTRVVIVDGHTLFRRGVRNILELHALSETHSLELVLHHATKDSTRDQRLLTMPMPGK